MSRRVGLRSMQSVGGKRVTYAYVASELDNALTIFDVTDPTNPTHLGVISTRIVESLFFRSSYSFVGER